MEGGPCDVVHQQSARSPSVVRARDRAERLLPRLCGHRGNARSIRAAPLTSAAGLRGYGAVAHRVPDLELDLLVVYRDHTCAELDADGEVVHWLEALVRELQEQARLPDAGVADDDVPARTQGAALTLVGSPGEGGV